MQVQYPAISSPFPPKKSIHQGTKADNIKASNSNFMVTKDNAPSKDDVKDEKATKAVSKATTANKTEKGEEADELKAEKATKANSKATEANMTEKV